MHIAALMIMDIFGRLGSFLLFSSVILQVIQQCDSQLIVNIRVDGWKVVQTGIRTYVFKPYDHGSGVIITCSSPISLPTNISLLDSNKLVIETNVTSENGITMVRKGLEQPEGKYYCLLSISTWILNDSYCEFAISSEIEIMTESTLPLYASSIGNSGYVGERAFLRFTQDGSNVHYCPGEKSLENVTEFFIDESFRGETCICHYCFSTSCHYTCSYNSHYCSSSFGKCSMFRLSVYPFLKLDIFVDKVSLDTSVMEVSCNSTPPRLMYWKVFGTHGNLLDFDNINHSLTVNTSVNITQSLGKTSLRISEIVPGGNGIHTVMCSTYDTEKRVIAFRRIQTTSECSSICEKSFLEPTDMQTTTFDNHTTTVESTTLVMTTAEGDSNDVELASQEQGCKMKTDTMNDYLLIGVVSLPYLVIILILIGIICYMNYKNRKKTELSTESSAHYTPPETVLHDNPVYLAFSETKDCIPDNVNKEREITYANL